MVFQRFYFLRRQIGGHKCLIKANFILLRYFKIQPENETPTEKKTCEFTPTVQCMGVT